MNITARSIRVTLSVLVLVLSGCGGGGDDVPPPSSGGTSPPPAPGIGSSGGTVTTASGASVTVPAGALATNVAIAIDQTASGSPALPDGVTPIGAMFAVTPHGTTFAMPATVILPFDASLVTAGATPALYKTNAANEWEEVPNAVFAANTVTAEVTSFSFFQSLIPPLVRGAVDRSWTFYIDSTEETKGEAGVIGGELLERERFDVGPFDLNGDAVDVLEVFSSEDGVTFWANAENHGFVNLWQTQSFTKMDASATLEFVITVATLEAIDANLLPTSAVCPHGTDVPICSPMYAHISYRSRAIDTAGRLILQDDAVPMLDTRGFAQLRGRSDVWQISTDDVYPGHTTRAWSRANFSFTTDADESGLPIHPKLQLREPIVIRVDLDDMTVGETFFVETILDVYAKGRGGESTIGAYLRDPAHIGGAEIRSTGLQLTNLPLHPRCRL